MLFQSSQFDHVRCGAAKTTVSAAESNPTSASGASATLASKAVNGVETFTTASVLSAAAPAAKAAPPVSVVREQDLHDLADAVISPGTICKRKTCGKEYYDVSSRSDECIHHPGVPVFHEGSKGWTCCSRRVLEFDLFLKIQGCTTAKHRFTDIQVDSTESTASRTIECRRDWYQTPDTIILSVFAKKMDKEATTVVFEDSHLKVDIKFLDGSTSQYHTSLFQPIDPALSKFQILSTKLEIVMKKANGISWVSIEPKENVTSWTTFGITGSVGTVGGKEAIIGNDAPLHLLSKSE
ncbi:hypothetical protein BSLG_005448 [Batrachochytrium salamandrivorans]|nr:hypothetical protein BSLG_005448 [Batrachochytrium salamandrivorans]